MQPFELKTRHGIALVFAYWGGTVKTGDFMQKASHATRAYYVNANGLKGFVTQPGIIAILKKAEAEGRLDEITKHQEVDL